MILVNIELNELEWDGWNDDDEESVRVHGWIGMLWWLELGWYTLILYAYELYMIVILFS